MTESEKLLLKAERLDGAHSCSALMGRYAYYYSAFRLRDIAELFAKRDDSLLVMPWGCYDGWESIRRCFVDEMGDRENPGMDEFMKGKFFLRQFNTELIRVAQDGKTARAFWICMGQDGYAKENGFTNQDYVWSKYAVEFICEDGQWKIWKLHIYTVFSYPFDRDWTMDPAYKGFTYPNAHPDRPLPRPLWLWTIDGPSPEDEPDWPLDYDTYTDIGYV